MSRLLLILSLSLAGCGGAGVHAGWMGSKSVEITTTIRATGISDPKEAGKLAREYMESAPSLPKGGEDE